MENKSGDKFTLFSFVQKALPQLHFVLIMKSEFVSIMTNGGSSHYQQTVLRYNSQTLRNSTTQPVCSHQRNSLYLFPTLFSFCCCCKLSAIQSETPSLLFHVISQLTNKTLFHAVWHSQNFSPTLERPPFCLLVRSKLWRFFQSEPPLVLLKLLPIQFTRKRHSEWTQAGRHVWGTDTGTDRQKERVYYYIVATLLTSINVSPIRETGWETGWSHEGRWA